MQNTYLDEPQFAPVDDMQLTHMKVGNVGQPEDRVQRRAPRDLPFLIEGDMMQVHNESDVPFVFRWARKNYVVPPRGDQFVPFEACVNQLGDPRSVDGELVLYEDSNGTKGMIRTRYDELCSLYAMYAIAFEDKTQLPAKAPKVSVRTMTGIPVTFPVHSPDMLPWPAQKSKSKVDSDVTRMYANLQAENEDLAQKVARMEEMMDDFMRQREGVEASA